MQIVVVISEVLAIIILLIVAYIATIAWKSKAEIKATVKDGIDQMKNLHEPDTLIEAWQQGYIISLKTFFQQYIDTLAEGSTWYTQRDRLFDIANKLQVVKEMNVEYTSGPPEAKYYKQDVLVLDKKTGKEWQPDPITNEKFYQ